VLCLPAAYIATITETVFYSRRDAEVAGLTEAADAQYNALGWEHIKDFYAEVPEGAPLLILPVANDLDLVDVFTTTSAAYSSLTDLLKEREGLVRLLAVALNPVTAEAAGPSGITADLLAAIPLAQTFAVAEFNKYRPIDVLLEGRAFSGTSAAAYDLRTLGANSVAVMVGRESLRADKLVAAGLSVAGKFAAVGTLLGRAAAEPVQRSVARVRSGKLTNYVQASLSGGKLVKKLDDVADVDVLTDKGYIFPRILAGKNGFFFNDCPTCTAKTDDYAWLNDSRVIKKAARITRAVLIEELNEDVAIDPASGKLSQIAVAVFKNALESAIEDQMKKAGEISGVTVEIDPNQNVTATDKIKALVRVVKKATARTIEATVEFNNPFNQ
jgi:hypothetical protein